jgi:hypothetical protein
VPSHVKAGQKQHIEERKEEDKHRNQNMIKNKCRNKSLKQHECQSLGARDEKLGLGWSLGHGRGKTGTRTLVRQGTRRQSSTGNRKVLRACDDVQGSTVEENFRKSSIWYRRYKGR